MEQSRKISCEANETELGVKVLAEASEGRKPRDAQSSNDNTEKYLENEHQFCLDAGLKQKDVREDREPLSAMSLIPMKRLPQRLILMMRLTMTEAGPG